MLEMLNNVANELGFHGYYVLDGECISACGQLVIATGIILCIGIMAVTMTATMIGEIKRSKTSSFIFHFLFVFVHGNAQNVCYVLITEII